MSNPLRCVPGDGLGNSFILLMEADALRFSRGLEQLAVELCQDRDGLLLVSPTQDEVTPLRVINRDGTEGGVCFNGLRVAALWTQQASGKFLMDGYNIAWQLLEDGVVELHLPASELPSEMCFEHVVTSVADGVKVPFWNPHAVFPLEDIKTVDLDSLATEVRTNKQQFPTGVNVEVISPAGDRGLQMRVNERGVGETMACGSGAVAVALLAWAQGTPRELAVAMPGGILVLSPAADGGILLAGKATLGEAFEARLSS